jgi:NAD(P)-dependent dehydrogenase (short-subunit alcohol dehydrogenase family)
VENKNLWIIGGANGIGAQITEMAIGRYDYVNSTDLSVNVTSFQSINSFLNSDIQYHDVVYCPGVNQLEWIKDIGITDALFDTFDVNVFGFLRILTALVNKFPSGNIVALVSDAAKNPMRGSMAYCASKAALAMAIRVAARELAPFWRINGVSPSIVDDTKMTKYIDETVPGFRCWTKQEAQDYELASTPMMRRCGKSEVAQLVFDVLSGPAYMTGSIVDITGAK